MGQYYRPTLINENGKISFLVCYNYNNGAKLMEHSYVGNEFVNAVLSCIWKNPMKLAWIGDYSDSPYEDAYAEKIPKAENPDTKRIDHGSIDKLYNAFLTILEKTERRMPPPKDNFEGIVGREPASVKKKATGLVTRLRKSQKITFSQAFEEAQHKNEIVAIFLAILELMKLNHIYVYDDDEGNLMLSLGEKSDEELEYNFE